MSIQASNTKRKHFRIALAAAEISSSEFARRQGVSHAAVARVLDGKTTSRRLTRAIDRFIDSELSKLNCRVGTAA